MINKNKHGVNDSHQEKKYQFIREQIRPQRKKQVFNVLRRLVIVIVFAGVFGGIAGTIMLSMQKKYREEEKDIMPLNTYSAAPENTEEIEKDEESERVKDNKPEISLKSLNRMSERLAALGEKAGSFIVGVRGQDGTKDWLESEEKSDQQTAFGMIIKETGKKFYIITTCDILSGQPFVKVQLDHNTFVKGTIQGSDPQLNLAAVSIEKKDVAHTVLENITIASLGNGRNLKKGTNVVAIGCPNGVLGSVVTGGITNDTIRAPITDGEVELFTTTMPYSNISNGVILDLDSNVVGFITTEFVGKTGTSGLSFINISSISTLLNWMTEKKTVPYIGCEGRSITNAIAQSHNLAVGAYITDIYSDSPAYAGGMRVADIVTDIDGEEIAGMTDIHKMLLQHKKGDTIRCTVTRGVGKKKIIKELNIKLG